MGKKKITVNQLGKRETDQRNQSRTKSRVTRKLSLRIQAKFKQITCVLMLQWTI